MGQSVSKQIELVDKESKGQKGISFYCSIRHEYIFIKNVQNQNYQYDCAKEENKSMANKGS